jgi:hypothetical protein
LGLFLKKKKFRVIPKKRKKNAELASFDVIKGFRKKKSHVCLFMFWDGEKTKLRVFAAYLKFHQIPQFICFFVGGKEKKIFLQNKRKAE